MMGLKQSKSNRLKFENLLRKSEEFSYLKAKGKTVIAEDVDFDNSCFWDWYDNHFLTLARLWPQNYLSQPPTPIVLSDDSGFDTDN